MRAALELVSAAVPERTPAQGATRAKALLREADAFGGYDDGEWLSVDLDLTAERGSELQCH